jgi:transposase InsO family protein
MELTLKERKKLTRLTARKYQKAGKRVKTAILNTFISQTDYERKYAIHLLANEGKTRLMRKSLRFAAASAGGSRRVYKKIDDNAVLDALIIIWEAFNYQCGKLLAPFLRANIDSITADPQFAVSDAVRLKPGRISAATIDRLLRKEKAQRRIKGTSGTKAAAAHIKSLIPVMSHFQCTEQGSGLWQIDLVQHDGGNPSGEFCFTLTITEVKNCWTVHYPLKNKAFRWVYAALGHALTVLPLPVRILHSDNGSEFINHALLLWCQQQNITLTRSRGNRKNDNCFVEQKNYASVRKIVGYKRFSDEKGVAALQAVYSSYDNLLNYFYPCQKLVSKERLGSKVKKTYDKPQTPFDRAVSDVGLPKELKNTLIARKAAIDLMSETAIMNKAIDKLSTLADPVPEFVAKRTMKPLLFGSYGLIF